MTKREMFSAIRERVADNAEMVEFIDHEIELLARKRSSAKPTKTQIANEGIKEQIMAIMTPDGMTATEVLTALGNTEFKVQKVSALLKQLVGEGKVVKDIVGKVSYFSLAE